jgi:tetratricopeptide (TPR) repeat protein
MALRIDSLDPIANYNYGKVMYYQGQIKQAIFHFERALNRTNQYPEWFLDLGAAYFSLKDPENALLAFNAAAKLNPSNPDSWSNIGAVYASVGNTKEAETAWLKAIESDNLHFKSYNDLIKLYLNSHDYDKARTTKQKLENLGGDLSPELRNF